VDEFLSRLSSPEVSEWMAYFIMLDEDGDRPAGRTSQSASGDAAIEVLRKHAVKR
jgi:hypothetical protein